MWTIKNHDNPFWLMYLLLFSKLCHLQLSLLLLFISADVHFTLWLLWLSTLLWRLCIILEVCHLWQRCPDTAVGSNTVIKKWLWSHSAQVQITILFPSALAAGRLRLKYLAHLIKYIIMVQFIHSFLKSVFYPYSWFLFPLFFFLS